jgi:hypothetical protein
MIDEYMDKLPVFRRHRSGNQEPVQPFMEASVDRLIVPYVPVTELVIDGSQFR